VARLSFFGGQNEIGGNKILLEGEGTRLFLDFGSSFSTEGRFFDVPFLQPSNLDDLLAIGAVPDLEGIYKNKGVVCQYDDYGFCGTTGKPENNTIDAVLVSHAHIDHVGYLGLLNPGIKLYGSKVSKTFLAQRREIMEDFKLKYDDSSFASVDEGQEFEVGSAKIRHIGVDHSIPGASAFIIEIDGIKVGYSGDLRLHGRKPELTENFIRQATGASLDYLLCEGTRINPHGHDKPRNEDEMVDNELESRSCKSEAEVATRVEKIIDNSDGIVIYDSSPADMDRMEMVIGIARSKGRHVLIDSRKAFITKGLNEVTGHYPALDRFPNCSLLLSRAKTRIREGNTDPKRYKDDRKKFELVTATREAYEYFPEIYIENRNERNGWEKEIIDHFDNLQSQGYPRIFWGPDMRKIIKDNPKDFLIYTSSGPNVLMHLGPVVKGTYIYGKAEPFNEEMEVSFKKLVAWTQLNDMKFEYAHTSGHASYDHLNRIVNAIRPKHLLPIHTTNADLFTTFYDKVHIYENFAKLDLKPDFPVLLS
jgi:ribonuclease J